MMREQKQIHIQLSFGMKMVLFVIGFLVGLTYVGCETISTSPEFVIEDDSYYPNIEFADTFDWKLLKELSSQHRNVLISPISLKLILALLYQGSSGITQREFQNVLQFTDKNTTNDQYSKILSSLQRTERSEYLLNVGTSFFIHSEIEINPNFERTARLHYHTDVKPTNFSDPDKSARSINSWIENVTNGKVSQLVNPEHLQQTLILIANGIYFKGTWKHPFSKSQTYTGRFYVSDDFQDKNKLQTVKIQFMSTTDVFYTQESSYLDSTILRLPYKGSSYAMYIILPNSLGGLPSLIQRINLNHISALLHKMEKRVVEVHIPKFKFNFQTEFSKALQDFGLHQIFENTVSFTGITKGNNTILRRLVVSDILQTSGIELDEEGSVVYTTTDVNIGNKNSHPKEIFNASHPFLFFIEGPNGSILFIGKVQNPLQEQTIDVPVQSEEEVFSPDEISQVTESQFLTSQQFSPSFSSPNVVSNFKPVDRNVGQNVANQESNFPTFPNLDPNGFQQEFYDKDELTYSFNLFDLDLISAFSDTNTNVFISPASIKIILAMILEGAKGNCANEISEALRLPDLNQRGVRDVIRTLLNNLNERSSGILLENSNALFASNKYKVLDRYQDIIEEFYRGNVKTVNFKNTANAVSTINTWVSTTTHGAIRELVGPQSISPETSVVIGNALYFKGKWNVSFDESRTETKCFNTLQEGCVLSLLMQISGYFNYRYISRLKAHAVEIPYKDKFSMLIILPSENSNIRSVVRNLRHFKLADDILSKLSSTEITLTIPKFEFEYSADLVEYLKSLRIEEIFNSKANLSGIIERNDVFINSLIHKTKIELDEQGTVAAAASGAVVVPLMGTTDIVANRPFAFYIYHKETTNIIFEGILLNPQEQKLSREVVTNQNDNFRFRSRQQKRHI